MNAASSVGITAFITNSDERIDAQLNRITRIGQLPIALLNWDLETSLEFDDSGFLLNPSTSVTMLLMTKAIDTTHKEYLRSAEEMAVLFTSFINNLNNSQREIVRDGSNAVTGASYTLVPTNGAGKHSGVIGRFTLKSGIILCKEEKDCKDCDKH